MHAFHSEQELASYLKQMADKQERRMRAEGLASAAPTANQTVEVTAQASKDADKDDSVTNVQHAGVDEGGIVKVHGKHLVMLRRGRLFTVSIADGALTPVSSEAAFGPVLDPRYTVYAVM